MTQVLHKNTKVIITAFFWLISNMSIAQAIITKEEVRDLKSKLPKELIIEPDYVEHIIWIKTPQMYANGILHKFSTYTPDVTHEFYFKVTKNDNGEWVRNGLHYVIRYRASNWLFVNKMLICTAKTNKETWKGLGTEFTVLFPKEKENTNIGYSPLTGVGVYESFDIYNNDQIIQWLKNISETRNFTRLRIYGDQKYIDASLFARTFTPQATAMTTVLNCGLFKISE